MFLIKDINNSLFQEKYMETVLQSMATNVSPLLRVLAPEAFSNMVKQVKLKHLFLTSLDLVSLLFCNSS